MKNLFVFTLLILLVSCEVNDPISPNITNGINRIQEFYNCEVVFDIKKDFDLSGMKKVILVKVKGEVFEEFGQWMEVPASNIAMILHDYMSNDERGFNEMIVELIAPNGKKESFVYSSKELSDLKSYTNLFIDFMVDIQDRRYEAFARKMDPSIFNDVSSEFVHSTLYPVDTLYGSVDDFTFHGAIFRTLKDRKEEVIVSYGVLHYIKQSIQLKAIFKRNNRKLVLMDLNWSS